MKRTATAVLFSAWVPKNDISRNVCPLDLTNASAYAFSDIKNHPFAVSAKGWFVDARFRGLNNKQRIFRILLLLPVVPDVLNVVVVFHGVDELFHTKFGKRSVFLHFVGELLAIC